MPYEPTTWQDSPSIATPLDAANLNKIENGLFSAYPVFNVKDPAYGAKGDAVTDDTAAIQAAINAAYNNGIVLFPAGQYIISSPLNVVGLCQLVGGDSRVSVIIASASFSGSQMIRNWVDADWQSGETNHRVAPSNPTFSGTHAVAPYARIRDLGFNLGGVSNLAGVSWVAPNETSLLQNIVIASGSSASTNLGLWGVDIQGAANGFKAQDVVFYGAGWERQISADASSSSGSDVTFEDVTFAPTTLFHSRVYVNNVDNFTLSQFHMETAAAPDAGAFSYIYLVSHTGFGSYSIRDGSLLQNSDNSKPFIQQDNDQAGNLTRVSPPLVERVKLSKTSGTWTGNLIADQYNSIPLSGAIGDQSAANIEVIHRYDGSSLVWSNNDGSLGAHYYKAPDLVDGYVNLTYGTTVNIDASAGGIFYLSVTGGAAFTIANPTNYVVGKRITITIKNNSGGAMGAITWGSAFGLAGAFTNPGAGSVRTISFYFDGPTWFETARAQADI